VAANAANSLSIPCTLVANNRSGVRLWLLAFVGFWLLTAGWAFASPYNGPPDEQQHVIRAAGVWQGELVAEQNFRGAFQTVPDSLIRGWCFPTKVDVAASCEREPGGDQMLRRIDTSAGRFNPVFHLVTTWPLALAPDWPGIMLSRLLNGAAMAALLASALVAAARWTRHRALVAGVVVAATPMIAHLGGSVNPSGVEIAAGTALFVALIAVVHEQRDGVNRAAVALAGVSGSVLVTPRFTGIMWLAVILGVVLVPSSRARLAVLARSRHVRIWSAVVGVSTLASLAWTYFVKPADPSGLDRGYSVTEIMRTALLDVWPNVANQMVGVMGWAETLMPRLVYVAWFAAVGLLVLGGLVVGDRTDRWRLLALFFGTFTPLLLLEILTANQIGWFNQGRYFLPGAVGLPLLGAYVLARQGFTAEQFRSMTRLLAIVLLPIHLVCLAYTMSRWQSGLQSLNPLNGSWSPPYGSILPLALATLSVAVLLAVYWQASRVPSQPTAAKPPEQPVAVPAETVSASYV
jgi:hypothetical protein